MASRRAKLISVAAIAAMGAGGWLLYNVLAAQAQGALAQAPLNNQVQVPPAFVMAVDDSNSMTFERIFPGGDGRMQWNSANSSFFSSSGGFHNVGVGCSNNSIDCYLYLFPHDGYNSSYSPGDAIPPLDAFGFARSHVYNASYFNPSVTYEPWRNADGTLWVNASITAAHADPRDPTVYGNSFSDAYNAVYDLTANRAETDERFGVLNGMSIPDLSARGMRYRRRNASNNNWTDNSWQTGAVNFNDNRVVAFDYFPATFYLPANDPAPAGYRTADVNRPIVNDACGPGCNLRRYEIKPANYSSTEAYGAAIQNFANWFQYHRNRLLAMVGAMSHAMQDVNNMRVGYFTINNRVNVTMRDVVTERGDLYDNFYTLQAGGLVNAGGGTPNRDAVFHLGEQFLRTGSGAPIQLACQRNGGMLFTDGFTNSDTGPTGIGHVDEDLGEPFADTYSNTIADIASRYYLNAADGGLAPLRSGGGFTAGQVNIPDECWRNKSQRILDPDADPRLDCQPNLHMNFYGVTLGARGVIYDVNAEATQDPFATFPDWSLGGNPRNSDGPATVDEIWHATINTRGEFVNARTPADITYAMRRILSAVSAGASPSGTQALTGSRISTRSLVVQPSYEVSNQGTNWFSTLEAFRVAMDPDTREVTETRVWEASDRLAATSASTRAAHTWYGHASGASRFNSSNITSLDMLCDNPRPGMSRCSAGDITSRLAIGTSEAVDYLLGETSGEVRRGGTLRDRGTVLGDIINSSPVVSAPTDDYGYRSLPSPYGNSYGTFMTAKQSRPAMVYVGANDGMLHAFHGGINHAGTVDSVNGGREQFAFIPRTVLGHMGNLLFPYVAADGGDQMFDHRYFVDGPVTVSDAYWSGTWKTVLVGTTGAGGRGVFGLDVSSPASFGATDYLWEIDDQHPTAAVRNNIGHVLGKPVVVPVKSGATVAWKAIFGNGYNSQNGNAVLFVVDIATGAVQMTQAVEPGAPTAGTNGLGNIVVVDRWGGTDLTSNARDGYADTVYAADQKGALWKFDLRTMAASIDTPLFTTREHTEGGTTYRQPILGGLTATAGRGAGVMILFGTGSFSFVNDASDASIQSIYGVLDVGATDTLDRSDLLQRTIANSTDETRTIADLDATSSVYGYSGWYVDLPAGERAVGYPRVASGVLFIPTYAPSVAEGCSTQGMNWLFGLNTRTGASALDGVRFGSTDGDTQGKGVGAVALDTEGTAPVKDVGLTVLSRSSPPNPGETGPGDDGCWIRITVPGMAQAMFVPYPCGRQSWRQIE